MIDQRIIMSCSLSKLIIFAAMMYPLLANPMDGTLDVTFNPGGVFPPGIPGLITTNFGGTANDQVTGVTIQTDGKILAGGFSDVASTFDFALARYTSSGALDVTFNPSGPLPGTLTTDISGVDLAFDMALQTDGKIILAGEANNNFALARYTTNGSLDTTFNPSGPLPGTVVTNFGVNSSISAVTLQANGKIVVAGTVDNQFAVARYNTNGSLDTTFNPSGPLPGTVITVIGSSSFASDVFIQADGKIVVAGAANTTSQDFAIVRYNTDGTLDASFNGTGIVLTNFSGSSFDQSLGVTMQPDGKIIAVGGTDALGGFDVAIARYNVNGSLDATFNGVGTNVIHVPSSSFSQALAVVLQSDGKIVLTGFGDPAGTSNFILMRFNPNGTLDATFNGTGIVITDFGLSNDGARTVAIQPDGKLVAGGFSDVGGGNFDFALARYNVTGAPLVPTTVTISSPFTTLQGTAQNPSNISIFVDNILVGSTVTIGTLNQWSFTLPPLAFGQHIVNVVSIYKAGRSNQRSSTIIFIICCNSDLSQAIRNKYCPVV